MLAEGVPPASIEQASGQAGYPAPVLQLSDELNMELMAKIRKASKEAVEADGGTWDDHPAFAVIDRMLELERAGKLARRRLLRLRGRQAHGPVEGPGAGVPADGRPRVDRRSRTSRSACSSSSPSRRCKCLDEGVIETVSDANIGSIFGIGFPGWTGGVLQYINGYEGGVAGFVERARELAAAYGDRFEPPASLVAKAESGELYLDEAPVAA